MRALLALTGLVLAAPALADSVSLTTEDGLTLHAETYGSGDKGVVLVHGKERSAEDWARFADTLATRGFHVIAVDLRGHGSSATVELGADDYPLMVNDVSAATAWMRANGASAVHLIGAELGANLVVNAAAADTEVADIVLLSPGMNLDGVITPTAIEAYGDRPSLAVASTGDSYAVRTLDILDRKAEGRYYAEVLPGEASGVRLLTRDAQLESKLIAWLNGTYDLEGQRASRTVGAEEADDVETSGVRFGE